MICPAWGSGRVPFCRSPRRERVVRGLVSGEEWIYDAEEQAAIDAWRPPEDRREDAGVAGLRRSTTSGALVAAVLLGLREVLEPPPDDEQAVVVDAPGEPDDLEAPLVVRFDPDSPAATVAIVRDQFR